jgi:hypothetical protein
MKENPNETQKQQPPPADAPPGRAQVDNPNSLRVDFSITVRGGDQVVSKFASGFEFALGLEPEFLASTDAGFGEVFNRLVTQPVEIAVRRHLQSRYEASSHPAAPAPLVAGSRPAAPPPEPEDHYPMEVVARNDQNKP